jgi:NADH-quinone oxidoreductase subunit M
MHFLNLFVIVPALTIVAILFTRDLKGARWASAVGMTIQLILAGALVFMYLGARNAGAADEMLFTADTTWFPSLNIRYAIGVDGISVAMIALTAIVIFAGVFASWEMEFLSREFFISLILLSSGVFGFFISLDLFTMFLFYELAVIPMYLLIGIWGSGPKEYSAMKLTLMLMGGSALLTVGILGLYFYSAPEGGRHSISWKLPEPTFLSLHSASFSRSPSSDLASWELCFRCIPGRPTAILRHPPPSPCFTPAF